MHLFYVNVEHLPCTAQLQIIQTSQPIWLVGMDTWVKNLSCGSCDKRTKDAADFSEMMLFSASAVYCLKKHVVFGHTESTFLQNDLYLMNISEYTPILLLHFQLNYTHLSIMCNLALPLPRIYFSWDSRQLFKIL